LFAMRMSNDRDQALLRSAVSDAAADLFGFVPSLGTREALAFGVGVPLPTRLTFSELPKQLVPRSETFADEAAPAAHDLDFIVAVLERWRGATARPALNPDDGRRDAKPLPCPETPPLQPSAGPDLSRFSLLRRPAADQAAPLPGLKKPASTPSSR
jgi:hypothetical protein